MIDGNIPLRTKKASQSLGQMGIEHSVEWNKAIAKGHRNMSMESRRNHVGAILKCNRDYGNRSKGGKREDLGGIYFRSKWESNYARYLNFLIANGEPINKWEFEVETFEFKKIKRGTRFYTPDFKITFNDGQFEFHEVKGWDYPKGRTARKRFLKYYPQHKLVLIDKDFFKGIKQQGMDKLIPNWE